MRQSFLNMFLYRQGRKALPFFSLHLQFLPAKVLHDCVRTTVLYFDIYKVIYICKNLESN